MLGTPPDTACVKARKARGAFGGPSPDGEGEKDRITARAMRGPGPKPFSGLPVLRLGD